MQGCAMDAPDADRDLLALLLLLVISSSLLLLVG
jgi:hypothetical protein